MVHRACKLARACVPAVEPVAFTTDVRRPNITGPLMFGVRTSQVNLWRLLTFPSAHKMVPFELANL